MGDRVSMPNDPEDWRPLALERTGPPARDYGEPLPGVQGRWLVTRWGTLWTNDEDGVGILPIDGADEATTAGLGALLTHLHGLAVANTPPGRAYAILAQSLIDAGAAVAENEQQGDLGAVGLPSPHGGP